MANRATDGLQNVDTGPNGELPPPRLLVIPDDAADEFSSPPAKRARTSGAAGKIVGGTLVSGALLLAGFYGYPLLRGSSRSTVLPVAPVTAAPARPALSALADTLQLAIGAFELRDRMFESHQMQCADLADGLVMVEERWTAYTTTAASGGVLDSAREARDHALYAKVDDIEKSFEHSACPRP